MNVGAEVAVALAKDNMPCNNATKSIQLDTSSESMDSSDTDSENDYENSLEQEDYPEENVVEHMVKFSANLDQMIHDNYTNFIELHPNVITRSRDNRTRKGDAVESKRPATAAASNALVPVAPLVTAGGAEPNRAAGGTGATASRRRSNLPCDSNALSSADLERLQKVADEGIRTSQSLSLNNSVCRRALQFLESSTEMHPLRMAKANRSEDKLHTSIRKLQCTVEDKEKRIETLRTNIADTNALISEHTNGQRARATKALKGRIAKLEADRDKYQRRLSTVSRHDKGTVQMLLDEFNTIAWELKDLRKTQAIGTVDDRKIEEYQSNLRRQQKELKRLIKATKKDRKALDELEAKLNCVRKVKKEHGRANGDTETIRHEIRDLRDQRDQLTDAQCALTQKLKRKKQLSDCEKRQMLEYDVTKEVIDDAMELKNQLLCGRDVTNPNAAFVDNPDLLSRLNEREMRALLRKCIKKIVDLRESSWQLEVQVIQAEHDGKEWQLRELNLLNRLEQMRLENEQHRLELSIRYEEMFTHLLRTVANGYADASPALAPPSPESSASMAMALRRNRFLENGSTRSPQGLQPLPHRYRAADNEIQSIRGEQ